MSTKGNCLFFGNLIVFAMSLTVILGCSESRTVPVHGQVTFTDGTPVTGGLVQFRSSETPKPILARGSIQSDGSYVLTTYVEGDGAVRGKHQVSVSPPPRKGDPDDDDYDPSPEIIMPKYGRYSTSGLEYRVTSESANQQVDFQMERGADR